MRRSCNGKPTRSRRAANKKQRYLSPSPDSNGSSKDQIGDEGKGRLKKSKGERREAGNDDNKNEKEKVTKSPKHAPETQAQAPDTIPFANLLSPQKVGGNGPENKAKPEQATGKPLRGKKNPAETHVKRI